QRAEKQALDAKAIKKQEAERKRLQAFIDRFKAKATKARQAQSRVKRLARMEPIAAVLNEEVRRIAFPPPAKMLSPPIIAFDKVSAGYEPGKPVLRRVTLRIDTDDRIALLGANGNGKSTLAKLLAGRLAPESGTITRAHALNVAYFAQHQLDELIPEQSVFDHVRRLMPEAPEAKVRARAGSIGFSADTANTPVATLSGGEKARLLIGLATFSGPHLVILDEPTNHLDVDGRAALADAINDYPGAVILVSHDRYLIEACADRLWLVGDGTVASYEGDLDDYRRLVLGRETKRETRDETEKMSRTDQRRAAAEKREELKPLKRRIDAAENAVARLTADIASIDDQLANGLFARDPVKATALSRARAEAVEALAHAEEDWLAASAAYEDAMGSPG
ncbi:MAG: ATP-binding cassette, subfamily er 3, partial [Hyphomicrobiales bacterium]|nr:ATP-binding cassette, subfamily er 3 [Hyphomicrobiales bacterium]